MKSKSFKEGEEERSNSVSSSKSNNSFTSLSKRIQYNSNNQSNNRILIGDRYEMESSVLLGKGSFGEVYLARDTLLRTFCVLKLENQKSKHPQLKNEKIILDILSESEGFPKVYDYGVYNEYNFMSIELLGPSLLDLFEACGKKFSLKSTLIIAVQMIQRVQELHSYNYIHRDIKPENFLVGIENKSHMVMLIDFGLGKKFKDNNNKSMNHIPYREYRPMIGTARYASINNHLGIEQSRRDDLEAIGYVLIYFLNGRLPWQGLECTTKEEKYNKILEKKLLLPTESLCKDLPIEFSIYMNYCKGLRFDERPDYSFLINLFSNLLLSQYTEPFVFDWLTENNMKDEGTIGKSLKNDGNDVRSRKNTGNISNFSRNISGNKVNNNENLADVYNEQELYTIWNFTGLDFKNNIFMTNISQKSKGQVSLLNENDNVSKLEYDNESNDTIENEGNFSNSNNPIDEEGEVEDVNEIFK